MKNILVVDDEEEIRRLIKEKLTQGNKYGVFTASSAQEALDVCKSKHPDMVLLDIVMPEMDGYSICEKLSQDKETKNIPILFITGKDLEAEGIMERCEKLGAAGYISKSTTLQKLSEKIEEILQSQR